MLLRPCAALTIIALACGFASADDAASADRPIAMGRLQVGENAAPTFRNHIQPILTRYGCNSGACHGAAAGQNGFKLSLRGYDADFDHAAITRHAGGRRIAPADPGRSLLLLKATGSVPHKGGVRFEVGSPDYGTLAAWIAAGQPGPSANDSRLERLTVLPATLELSPGETQQLVVQATFTDGHTEDVTRWARYTATDQTVATTDNAGNVTVVGHGEGAVLAWYLTGSAIATVRVPYPQDMPQDTAASPAPPANFIDELVNAKLDTLHLPASPPADDATWLRRAFLDTIGLPPTPDEVRGFLADTDPDKRAKLVDTLLARPEFVDFWAYRWSDLLLVNSETLKPKAAAAYYGWIRQQVAQNTPWNEFARQIVTATGSTLENGAANFYVLHADPHEMSETVSMTFLGMAINCARCHDHPLEKWTNDQYFGMANLFGRVRSKGAGDDLTVFVADTGDLVQPRTGKPQHPTPLDGTPLTFDDTRDRREALADWLTAPKNPYFARAIVNRIWANFLGVGLVEAVDDLRLTNPPSNPALLDALEDDFISHGYDTQRLMRLILSSHTYARSSEPTPANAADTRFYAHFYPRRLRAEVLLDATSQATLAPTQFKDKPSGTRALQLPDVQVASYFLDTFGRPDRLQTCECERSDMPSMKQVLHLMNGDTLNEKLAAAPDGTPPNRIGVALAAGKSNAAIIEEAYLATLARQPAPAETAAVLAILDATPAESHRAAVEDLYWGLLTSKEFLFQH